MTSGLVSGQSVAKDVSAEELEDSFLVNPKYRYSFKVFDDDKQVYQDQSQQMADRVCSLLPLRLIHTCCSGLRITQ